MTAFSFGLRGFTSYVALLRLQIQGFFAALRMTAFSFRMPGFSFGLQAFGFERMAFNFRREGAGEDVHGGGVGAYGGGVYPGAVVADAEVVDEVAGFEVVGAVEYDVRGEEGGGVLGDQVGDVGVDADAGVDAGEVAAGGFGFGEGGAGVVFVEEHLALEVGGFYEVAVDEGKAADASAGEEAGGGGSGGADSDDGDVGAGEELLAGRADGGEEDLAGVAVGIWDRV